VIPSTSTRFSGLLRRCNAQVEGNRLTYHRFLALYDKGIDPMYLARLSDLAIEHGSPGAMGQLRHIEKYGPEAVLDNWPEELRLKR